MVLLRGINVGGKNKIKMDELRFLCKEIGASDVKTYIQSGNVVLSSSESSLVIANSLSDLIRESLGFDINVIAIPAPRFKTIVADFPFDISGRI